MTTRPDKGTHLNAIVEDGGRGREGQVLVRNDFRLMPSMLGIPINFQHVIGKCLSEDQFLKSSFGLDRIQCDIRVKCMAG